MRYLFLLALTFSFIALSFNSVHAAEGNEKGLLDKLKGVVAEVITGDDESDAIGGNESDYGNENALEQIDKNLEKHGGEHKGLENARAAVSKSKHKNKHKNKKDSGSDDDSDGDDLDADDLIDDAVGAVEEALIGEDVNESLSEKSKVHKGKGKDKSKGRGHSK